MKTVQLPITNDQDLAGYRAAAARLEGMIVRHEDDLIAARQAGAAETHRVDQIRYTLARLYAYRQGTLDAIDAYLRRQQSA